MLQNHSQNKRSTCFLFSEFGKSVDLPMIGQAQLDISHYSDKYIRVNSASDSSEGKSIAVSSLD